MIAWGEADVLLNGRRIGTLGLHDSFGEIPLLRDRSRTAEVRARTPLDLYALDRDLFVRTVNGYRAAASEANRTITRRLATFAPRMAAATPSLLAVETALRSTRDLLPVRTIVWRMTRAHSVSWASRARGIVSREKGPEQ